MNVFELTATIKELRDKVDAGELSEAQVKDTLDSLEIPRNQKLDGLANWIESNNARIAWAKEKREQIDNYVRSATKQNENLMTYLTQAIDATGHKEIKTEHHMFKPRNYKASTVIEQLGLIPKEYIKTTTPKPVSKPDRAAIYKALKAGKEVPGAHLKPNRKTTIL